MAKSSRTPDGGEVFGGGCRNTSATWRPSLVPSAAPTPRIDMTRVCSVASQRAARTKRQVGALLCSHHAPPRYSTHIVCARGTICPRNTLDAPYKGVWLASLAVRGDLAAQAPLHHTHHQKRSVCRSSSARPEKVFVLHQYRLAPLCIVLIVERRCSGCRYRGQMSLQGWAACRREEYHINYVDRSGLPGRRAWSSFENLVCTRLS